MSRKRARLANIRGKRPIDKNLVVTSHTITTTVVATTLATTTFPCTVVGIRWELSASTAVASVQDVWWAIVIIPDGEAVKTPTISNAGTFYAPEQNVLAFGMGQMMDNTLQAEALMWSGSTKTMRKLKGGDVLAIATIGSDANGALFRGVVQFFCKS